MNLGKAAQKPGVLLVALSRVRHPDDLMLDDNFPDFRQLMRVRRNEAFKQRQLWEKQRHADFSRTIRQHCRDAELFGARLAWSVEEAAVADQLLRTVRALPNGTASADWLPAAAAEMPSVSLDAIGAVWERLQSFPHNVAVAEARGALEQMAHADALRAEAAPDTPVTLPTVLRRVTPATAAPPDAPLATRTRQSTIEVRPAAPTDNQSSRQAAYAQTAADLSPSPREPTATAASLLPPAPLPTPPRTTLPPSPYTH